MEANILCIAVLHPVVKLLVIAKIETLLLEPPLQLPVDLGDKEKARMLSLDGRNDINPIFRLRT